MVSPVLTVLLPVYTCSNLSHVLCSFFRSRRTHLHLRPDEPFDPTSSHPKGIGVHLVRLFEWGLLSPSTDGFMAGQGVQSLVSSQHANHKPSRRRHRLERRDRDGAHTGGTGGRRLLRFLSHVMAYPSLPEGARIGVQFVGQYAFVLLFDACSLRQPIPLHGGQ